MPKDTKLYDLLGVSPTANENDIRKAYYKLAKIHHPDKAQEGDNAEAEEKFKEIKFAYEVLSDKSKRDVYDQYGLEGLKDGVGGTEFEDIFSHLFGGFGGGGGGGNPFFPFDLFGGGGMRGGGRQAKRRTQNLVYPLKVTLEELYNGATKKIEFERSIICKGCDGKGGKSAEATKPCTRCKGRGFVLIVKPLGPGMVQQMQTMCPDCNGEGVMMDEKDRCKQCSGKKTVREKKSMEVPVDKGMHDSQKITFHGESNQDPSAETGDLLVVLQCEEHEVFSRNHDDLFMSHTINITEALCGFKMVVKHLDGRALVLSHPAGEVLAPGTIRGVPKEGMPIYRNPFEKGNLYVKFDVKFPDNDTLSEDAIKKLETILPARPKVEIPSGDHVEEVSMIDYEHTKGSSGAAGFKDATASGSDDEDGPHGGQRVECNTH